MLSMPYSFLADGIAVVHAGYVLFVVVGVVVILLGWWRGWSWGRNFWFRAIHLVAMLIVALETVFGWNCPLTDLEKWLRAQAGEDPYSGDFLAELAHRVLFWDLPTWSFAVIHVGMALVIVAMFYGMPPRLPGKAKRLVHGANQDTRRGG